MYSKIRICHYVSDKSCADFSPKMHQKRPAGSPDLPRELTAPCQIKTYLLDLRSVGRDKGMGNGKRQEGMGLLRKGDRGRREGVGGEEGREGRKDVRRGEREGETRNLAPTVISKSRRL